MTEKQRVKKGQQERIVYVGTHTRFAYVAADVDIDRSAS